MDQRAYQTYKPLPRTPREKAMRFVNDHCWVLLGTTWPTSMADAYGYSFAKHHKYLFVSQKFFHARVYAQMITLVATLTAFAELSWYVGEVDTKFLKFLRGTFVISTRKSNR